MRGTVSGGVSNNMPSLNQVCDYGYDAKSTPRFLCVRLCLPTPLVRVGPSLLRWRGVVRCLSAVISANTPLLSPLATAPLRASSSTRPACSTSACLSPLRLDSCVLSPSDRRLPPLRSFAPLCPATRHCSFATPSSSPPPPRRRSTPACSSTPLFLALFDRSPTTAAACLSPSDRRIFPLRSFAPLCPATRHCSFSSPPPLLLLLGARLLRARTPPSSLA